MFCLSCAWPGKKLTLDGISDDDKHQFHGGQGEGLHCYEFEALKLLYLPFKT